MARQGSSAGGWHRHAILNRAPLRPPAARSRWPRAARQQDIKQRWLSPQRLAGPQCQEKLSACLSAARLPSMAAPFRWTAMNPLGRPNRMRLALRAVAASIVSPEAPCCGNAVLSGTCEPRRSCRQLCSHRTDGFPPLPLHTGTLVVMQRSEEERALKEQRCAPSGLVGAVLLHRSLRLSSPPLLPLFVCFALEAQLPLLASFPAPRKPTCSMQGVRDA